MCGPSSNLIIQTTLKILMMAEKCISSHGKYAKTQRLKKHVIKNKISLKIQLWNPSQEYDNVKHNNNHHNNNKKICNAHMVKH